MNIVKDLQENIMSIKEIASKYNLDWSFIYRLNRGEIHHQNNLNYPLRTVQDCSIKKYYCIDCGAPICKGAVRCIKCSHLKQRKANRPERNILKDLIRTTSFVKIGEMFGVTDNAIRGWCKMEHLPYKKSEIKKYSDKEWQDI